MPDDDDEVIVYIPEELRDSIHEFEPIRLEGESEESIMRRESIIRALLNTARIVYFEWPPKKH